MDLLNLKNNPFTTALPAASRFSGVQAPEATSLEATATRFSASDNPLFARGLVPQYRPDEVIHSIGPGGVRDRGRTLGIG